MTSPRITVKTVAATIVWLFLVGAAVAPSECGAAEDQSDPGRPRSQAYFHYGLGRLMESEGYLTDALVQYRRAEAIDPGHCGVTTAVARTLLALGRLDDAVAKSGEALETCPDDEDVLGTHAEVLLARQEPSAAERILADRALGYDAPRQIAVLYARALLAQGRGEEGEDFLRARASVDSLDPDIAQMRARVLLTLDRPDEAVDEFRRSVRLDPNNRPVRGMLARLLVALERPEEAVPMLERIVSRDDALEAEYVSLAAGYSMLGDQEAAMSTLEDAVDVFGETPVLLRAVGAAHYSAGRSDEAIGTYERLLQREPESVTSLNFIAYTLAEEGRDLEHALQYAERAVALEPDNPLIRDTLGWVRFRMGRLEEARRELTTALELGGRNAVILEHLGDVLDAMGHTDEAVEAWEQALSLSPNRESTLERLGRTTGGDDAEPQGGTE